MFLQLFKYIIFTINYFGTFIDILYFNNIYIDFKLTFFGVFSKKIRYFVYNSIY